MSKGKKEIEEKRKAVIIGETFTRLLNPISNEIPELLLPLCGIPIIEYIIDSLASCAINEIIICAKYHRDKLEKYIKKYHKSLHYILYISEDFNSVGDCLRKVNSEKIISSDFILIRGLTITNIDLEKLSITLNEMVISYFLFLFFRILKDKN